MDRKTKFKRSAICVGVRFVRSARQGSFSSLRSAAFTASSKECQKEAPLAFAKVILKRRPSRKDAREFFFNTVNKEVRAFLEHYLTRVSVYDIHRHT